MDSKTEKEYASASIPKLVLKTAIPSFIMMLVFGLYSYIDSILAVQFAHYDAGSNFDQYVKFVQQLEGVDYTEGDIIRMMMSMTNATVQFAAAFTMFFAIGISTRIAVNLGKGEKEKAKNIMRVGTFYSIIVTIVVMAISLPISSIWVKSQYPNQDPFARDLLSQYSTKYANIVLWATPFLLINNVYTFVLRTEGNYKALMIATFLPTIINLGLDVALMGGAKMGIDGGAWATFIAWAVTSVILILFAWRDKSEYLNLRTMFGKKMYHPSIIGISIIGIPMFLNQFSFSITQTIANQQMGHIANAIGDPMYMHMLSSGVFPIFMLMFPAVMGVSQGSMPIASYNFGRKDMKRVADTVKWTIIISVITAIVAYGILAAAMGNTLLAWLGTEKGPIKTASFKALLIAGTAMIPAAINNGFNVYFGSTDRPIGNLNGKHSIWYSLIYPSNNFC